MADEPRFGAPNNPSPPGPQTPPARRPQSSSVRWLKRFGITLGVFLLVSGALLAFAEHRTSKPEFCGSCHIMEPYYESWHADLHGAKLDIACVECHYAPGERTTINAKLRGLSQVASYFSGRYGSSRPRAHVDNLSCTTSKCHGDMKFMDKEIAVGTVKFVHSKHLHPDEAKQVATQRELEELTRTLSDTLGKDRFEQLKEVAREATPAKPRVDRMTQLVSDWGVAVTAEQVSKFTQLNHREVRVAQLGGLQCTNCHSYVAPDPNRNKDPGSAHHFTVKKTACYTCHFTNESFNTGTASCLGCHTLPGREITVHKELSPEESTKLKTPELEKKPVRMDHREILNRKVDCFACHADVASENSTVTRRDCERCHDRPEYFRDWKQPPSLDIVKQYHSAHVPTQKAKCLDCHTEIHHQLVRGSTAAGPATFLSTVMADCAHCHPNQHAEQIELLSGMGGKGVPKADPNLMFGSRTNCFGCHVKQATTEHGGVTLRGAVSGCVSCHGDKHSQTFDKWKKTLDVLTSDANEAYENARKMLEAAKDLNAETRRKATDLLAGSKADLQLVKRGNGVHNFMYSMDLLDSITKRCQEAMAVVTEAQKKP